MNAQKTVEESRSPLVKEIDQNTKHSIHAEVGGRTFIWGSMTYEYKLHRQISFGGGLGLIHVGNGDVTRNIDGTPETGRYLDITTTQMIYGNYFIGKSKHQLQLTAGLTNFLITDRNKYTAETESSKEAQLEWNAGVGYQFSAKKTYFRVTGYCISLPEPSSWFPKYMPWIGVSMGLKL